MRVSFVDGYSLIIALFALTDRQRYIVVQRHMRGRTCEEIGFELGVTKAAISAGEQKALSHLRRRLAPFRRAA